MTAIAPSQRRFFFARSGGLTLSAAALGLLAGTPARAQSSAAAGADAGILNVALGLEHDAINAYQIGAGSGLLQKPVLAIALAFQGHHKAHRDALVAAIGQLGGSPVAAPSLEATAKALDAASLKSQGDVLALASRLELGAANAYLGVIPSLEDAHLGQVAARLAADETMHYTALLGALGQALPSRALSFGG